MAIFSTVMAKRKLAAEELLARAESNGYQRGPSKERQHSREQQAYRQSKEGLNAALDRYVLQGTNISQLLQDRC